MQESAIKKLAKPMLFAAAFIWGSSFFIMKNTLDAMPVQYLLAIRFTTGAVLLSVIFWKKWPMMGRDYLWRGAIIGACLYLAYSIQTYGLARTTPSKNAFLTAGALLLPLTMTKIFLADMMVPMPIVYA